MKQKSAETTVENKVQQHLLKQMHLMNLLASKPTLKQINQLKKINDGKTQNMTFSTNKTKNKFRRRKNKLMLIAVQKIMLIKMIATPRELHPIRLKIMKATQNRILQMKVMMARLAKIKLLVI